MAVDRAGTSFGLVGIVAASFGQNRLSAVLSSMAHGHPSAGPQRASEALLLVLLAFINISAPLPTTLCPLFYWPSHSQQLLSWVGGRDFSPKLLWPAPLLQGVPGPKRLRIPYTVDQRSTGSTDSALTLVQAPQLPNRVHALSTWSHDPRISGT